jgi:predicted nucleic acid-binding protein
MRGRIVVDAGVAVRWVVHGPGSSEADPVLDRHSEGVATLHAPTLQRIEVASALWKYQRAGLMSRRQMESSYDRYLGAAVHYHGGPWLDRTALVLAAAHDRSVYDCLYLALSIELGCELLTADRRFFNSVAAAFPQMRLLPTDTAQAGS